MDIKQEVDTIYSNLDKILKTDGINQAILVADTAMRLRNIYNEVDNVTEHTE